MRAPQKRIPHSSRQDNNAWLMTWLFSFFLGGLGIDRFYNGRTGLGIGKLLTAGGCGYWAMIDFILLLAGKYQNAQGDYLKRPQGRYMTLQVIGVFFTVLLAAVCLLSTLPVIGFIGLMSHSNFNSREMRLTSSSPADAWSGFQKAARENDFSTFFEYLTPESQDMMIGMTLMEVALKKAFRGPAAATDAEEERIKAVFEKHGISMEAGPSMQSELSRVPDKGQLFEELMEAQSDGDGEGPTDLGIPSGALTDVAITGDKATGKVDGETLAFKRVAGDWLIDLAGTMEAAMKTSFESGKIDWGEPSPGRPSRRAQSRLTERSVEELENGVLVTPNDPSAWYELAAKRTAYGDWAAAIDGLNRAFELSAEQMAIDPNQPNLKAAVLTDDRFYWLLQQNPEFKKSLGPSIE